MRLIKKFSLYALMAVFILSSCSVQKRHYSFGFNIDWIGKSGDAVIMKNSEVKIPTSKKGNNFGNNSVPKLNSEEQQDLVLIASNNKNVDENIVKSISLTKKRINKYSENNKSEVIERVKNKKEETKKEEGTKKAKSQLVALVLCIFVGILGIHRFYLGHIGIGIIQILTLGGCGIWALIDLIMIITGDLKPKDGSDYDPKL